MLPRIRFSDRRLLLQLALALILSGSTMLEAAARRVIWMWCRSGAISRCWSWSQRVTRWSPLAMTALYSLTTSLRRCRRASTMPWLNSAISRSATCSTRTGTVGTAPGRGVAWMPSCRSPICPPKPTAPMSSARPAPWKRQKRPRTKCAVQMPGPGSHRWFAS